MKVVPTADGPCGSSSASVSQQPAMTSGKPACLSERTSGERWVGGGSIRSRPVMRSRDSCLTSCGARLLRCTLCMLPAAQQGTAGGEQARQMYISQRGAHACRVVRQARVKMCSQQHARKNASIPAHLERAPASAFHQRLACCLLGGSCQRATACCLLTPQQRHHKRHCHGWRRRVQVRQAAARRGLQLNLHLLWLPQAALPALSSSCTVSSTAAAAAHEPTSGQ